MGYRSDVAFVIHFASGNEPELAFADYTKFKDFVVNTLSVVSEDASTPKTGVVKPYRYYDFRRAHENSNSDVFGWDDDKHVLAFSEEYVKWYDSFPEVQWVDTVFAHARSYETSGYRFVRFGEEITDTEIVDHTGTKYDIDGEVGSHETYWDMLQIERSFSLSPDPETLTI